MITCASSLHLADVSAVPLDCFYEPAIGEFICPPGPDPNPNPTPEVDDFNIQFTYQFETRIGDINADGRKDIFIKRNTGPSSNGVINKIMLTGNADGSFSIYNAATWELNSASDWPQKSIEVANNDFNVDGYFDVMLKDVGDHISGANDQIVYSNGQANGLAAGVTQMDDQFYKFFSNAAMYTADWDYFADHSEIGYVLSYAWVFTCNWGWNGWSDVSCGYTIVPISMPVIFYDEDVIDPDALLANLDMVAGDFIGAFAWWSDVLGIELDDNVVVDNDLAVCLSPSSLDQCDSMKILNKVLNRMLSSGQDQDELGSVVGSHSGQLRTRAVASDYSPFYHLSVHVPILGGLGLTTWNSAFPSNEDSQISDPGTLKSDYMKGSDHPWETRLIRTIYHSVYDNSHHFATQLDVASVSFDDTMLTYCHFPEINLRVDGNSCFGYNSNSFAIGLINHVGGILSPFAPTFGGKPLPNLTVWSHPGMNKPVPSNAF